MSFEPSLKQPKANGWINTNLLTTVFVSILLFFLLRGLDFLTLIETLRATSWPPVVLSCILLVVFNTIGRVMRFSTLLEALPFRRGKAPFWKLVHVILATRTLNMVLPAKAGEVLRAVQLKQCGYPVEGVAAALILEPLIELLTLGTGCLILFVFGFAPDATAGIFHKLILASAIVIAFFFFLALRKPQPLSPQASRGRKILNKLSQSIQMLNSPRVWIKSMGWTVLADGMDFLAIGLCLHALGLELNFIHWFVILAGINLAIAIPMPGNIGTLEAGAVLTLGALGIGKSEALAFALIYHAVNIVPIALAGAISLKKEGSDFNFAQFRIKTSP